MNVQLENLVTIFIRNLTRVATQTNARPQAEEVQRILFEMQNLVSKGLRFHQPSLLGNVVTALTKMHTATKRQRELELKTPRRFTRELHTIETLIALIQTDPLFRFKDLLDKKDLLDLLRVIGSTKQCFTNALFQSREDNAGRAELARLIELKLAVKIWIRSKPAVELTFDGRELLESLQSCANRSKRVPHLYLLPSK